MKLISTFDCEAKISRNDSDIFSFHQFQWLQSVVTCPIRYSVTTACQCAAVTGHHNVSQTEWSEAIDSSPLTDQPASIYFNSTACLIDYDHQPTNRPTDRHQDFLSAHHPYNTNLFLSSLIDPRSAENQVLTDDSVGAETSNADRKQPVAMLVRDVSAQQR